MSSFTKEDFLNLKVGDILILKTAKGNYTTKIVTGLPRPASMTIVTKRKNVSRTNPRDPVYTYGLLKNQVIEVIAQENLKKYARQ